MTRKPHRSINQPGVSLLYHIEARLDAIEKAVAMAKEANDIRLEGMNNFRTQLEKQVTDFVSRLVFDEAIKNIKEDINRFREVQLSKANEADLAETKAILRDHVSEQTGKELAINRMFILISLGSGGFGALLAWLLTHT
jgi:hypothetical protein